MNVHFETVNVFSHKSDKMSKMEYKPSQSNRPRCAG